MAFGRRRGSALLLACALAAAAGCASTDARAERQQETAPVAAPQPKLKFAAEERAAEEVLEDLHLATERRGAPPSPAEVRSALGRLGRVFMILAEGGAAGEPPVALALEPGQSARYVPLFATAARARAFSSAAAPSGSKTGSSSRGKLPLPRTLEMEVAPALELIRGLAVDGAVIDAGAPHALRLPMPLIEEMLSPAPAAAKR